MRILLVSNIFPPKIIGGYELLACDLAQRLSSEGHQVGVVSSPLPLGDEPNETEPFKVFRVLECLSFSARILHKEDSVRLGLFINLANIVAMDALIKELTPDAIICFSLGGLGALGLLHLFHSLGHQPIWYVADTLEAAKQHSSEIARFALFLGTGEVFENITFVGASSRVVDELAQDVGFSINAKALIPGWVTRCPGNVSAGGASSGPLRLVFASRIEPHKGIDLVLDAAALVRNRGDLDFQIDVFGAGRVSQFMQQAWVKNLETIVHYRGMLPKSEMLKRYRDYDALLFPTEEREPFGCVAVEAAAAGCIPILTAGIGAAEWMVDGLDCVKIRRDPIDLAAAIVDLARQEPAQRAAFRERVKRNAQITFDFEHWFGKMIELLEVTAAGHSPISTGPERGALSLGLLAHIWRG